MKRVYFIRPVGCAGPVKIGYSKSPETRLLSLSTWSPFPLEITAIIDGGLDLERRFHAHFADLHSHREWFKWSPALEIAIQQIRAGTFPLDSLPLDGRQITSRLPEQVDRSFLTPSYRYGQSVRARLQLMRNGGMPWTHQLLQGLWGSVSRIPEGELDAAKARIEPIMAQLRAQFPQKAHARRSTTPARKAA